MPENKTQPTKKSVQVFLSTIKDEQKRNDCIAIARMMGSITKQPPVLWGSIVGFGSYHYKSERSRQEGYWFLTGFSPRAQNITIYIMPGFEKYPALMNRLGKHSTGKSCLYVKRLSDVDVPTLKTLIARSVSDMKK